MKRTVHVIARGTEGNWTFLEGRGPDNSKQLFNASGLLGFSDDVFRAHKFGSKGQAEFVLEKHGHKEFDANCEVLAVVFEVIEIRSYKLPPAPVQPRLKLV